MAALLLLADMMFPEGHGRPRARPNNHPLAPLINALLVNRKDAIDELWKQRGYAQSQLRTSSRAHWTHAWPRGAGESAAQCGAAVAGWCTGRRGRWRLGKVYEEVGLRRRAAGGPGEAIRVQLDQIL